MKWRGRRFQKLFALQHYPGPLLFCSVQAVGKPFCEFSIMQDRMNRMNRLSRESYSPEGPEEA